MKVLQINSVCGIRSTGRICTDIADSLFEQGHMCKIAYGRDKTSEKYREHSVHIGTNADVILHAAAARIFDCSGFGSKFATKRFIKWIYNYDPDIIHLHNLHGYYINIEELFKYLAESGKPVVWTLHDCWAFTGHCTHFTAAGCDRWKTGCYSCPQKTKYPSSLFFDKSKVNLEKKKKLFSNINKMVIVTPSHWLSKLVKESFLGVFPSEVIHNGIDTDIFKPTISDFREKHSLKEKKIVLGVAGDWDEGKGLNDFIWLSKRLDESYKIVLAGMSDKQIKKIPDVILGIKKTDSPLELAKIYSAADYYLNLSMEETMGMTTVEAAACGTSAIVYNATANAETSLAAGGIVVDCAPKWVYKAIINGKTNKTETNAVKKNFDKRTQFSKYIDLYKLLF